ncbi:hypothetical protein Nepgr_010911 [Nepenthes gracilis]|uniref:Pentatricopeptide repeat-containing protein At5g66520-like n=1 Tax=Nepenthes gracilis TaxID=150966 RepID=A0AAD3SE47_NEPGR|nr:hypothetical protein Nepgr_010911 [Nepenthes gracilis]
MNEPQRLYFRNSLLRLINGFKAIRELKQAHSQIIKSPYLLETDRYFLTTRLLFFCAISEFGSLPYATNIFQHIHNPNLFVYNAMIRAYVSKSSGGHQTNSSLPLILYKQMLFDGIRADSLTFPFVIKECTRMVYDHTGRAIDAHVIKFGFHDNLYIQNALISFYCECRLLAHARKLFDEMSKRDIVSWNAMVGGCLKNGDLDSAWNLFRRMEERNIYTWNSMITGFVNAGLPKEALQFFQEMQMVDGNVVRPDKITIASVLSACASLGAIDHGNWVHGYLKRSGLEFDMVIRTALIDMYGKCGHVERAVEVFKEMLSKDVLAWTAMISVFALHGYAKEALDLLKEMDVQEVKPNHITFVGLLSACAHSGFVKEGRWCFDAMRHDYSVEPQVYHYASMVDILSRAALFEEAEALIRSMPMEPDVFVWGALLGGCQMHGNVELGEKVALRLINLEPFNHAFYINLCDIYAKAGRFDDVKRIRNFMQEKGIQKSSPGCSMIEVDGIVHEFSVRGSQELMMEDIIWVLKCLICEMRMNWHVNDFDS